MSTDAERVLQRQLQRLNLEEQAATSDYQSHLYNHDDDSAAEALMSIANARQQKETLIHQWNAEQERNTYRAPYASEAAREKREPHEMDQQDLANIMNTSRYSGKKPSGEGGFTAQDYDNLRRGLGGYKATRGTESK